MPRTKAKSPPATIASTLAASIERQITEGAFRVGDKLPSLRELSELHGYAKNTVVVTGTDRSKNYHIGDYNIFYLNIREDVKRRVDLFLNKK